MSNPHDIGIYLAAAVLLVALMKHLGFAAVLGYLLAGIVIGPFGLGLIGDLTAAQQRAQFGVILLLFLIGLELQPSRLWAMRRAIFGMGSAQLGLTGLVLTGLAWACGLSLPVAGLVGCGLAMSSTAFVLQLMAEKHELALSHGRASFAILLFQDIAVIPLLALVPLLAAPTGLAGLTPLHTFAKLLMVAVGLFVISRFLVRSLFAVVVNTGVRELFTATALLVVIATSLLMDFLGLSVTLGAFLAGVLLADSDHRHELEACIAPFEGLLLGLFFIAVGMSANLGLLVQMPLLVGGAVLALMGVKMLVLYGVARGFRLPHRTALKLAAALSQGGEFAFILFGVMRTHGVLMMREAEFVMLVVTLSMALTPFVYALASKFAGTPALDPSSASDDHAEPKVVIAGFGRFGQITGRVLRTLKIPFTMLEIDPAKINLGSSLGGEAYTGDAANLTLLHAAGVATAQFVVVAIDDPDASVRLAELLRRHFPAVRIFARARDRQHVFRLMDLGVTHIQRETYHSSMLLTEQLLEGLGLSRRQANHAVSTFQSHDERELALGHVAYKEALAKAQKLPETAAELQALLVGDDRLREEQLD